MRATVEGAPGPGAAEERVLVLAPIGRDATLTVKLLSGAGLQPVACTGMGPLCQELEAGAGALLLTEESLTPAAMHTLGQALGRQPPWSDIPLFIFPRSSELTRHRLETLRAFESLGNVIYLERPIRAMTLISTLRSALVARRRQYEMRDHLRERQRMEEALQRRAQELAEADQRKDQFLAMLSHELRNPLTGISNGIHLLDRIGSPDERPARVRAMILRQTRHLSRLVEDLLEISRFNSGKIALQRSPLDLREVVRRCLQTLEESAKAQRHHVFLHLPQAPLQVDGDTVRLEQTCGNLLMNAIKYTPPGGRIEVSAAKDGHCAVVSIRDSGVGIAPEMLPRVFDLFTQAPGSLDRAQGGLGIGLTLVRRLVELHGGSVAARSDGLGRGSQFIVRLPLLQGLAATEAPQAREPAAAPHRHVLLVEDNDDIREEMQMLLVEMGHEVVAVGDGPRGVEVALARRPQVALIDIGLPGIDGYEVAARVRAALGAEIFLIAMTGYGQPDDRRRSHEAGFNAHLTKPPDIDALQHLLESSPMT